jgi:hypothetical protein
MCDDVMFYWIKILRSSRLRFDGILALLLVNFSPLSGPLTLTASTNRQSKLALILVHALQ